MTANAPPRPKATPPTDGAVRPRPAGVFALLAVLFFSFPILLYVLGFRAQAFENRPLAEFPSPRLAWAAVDELGAWFIDHLPLRDDAVRWRAEVSDGIFDEPPPSNGPGGVGVVTGGGGTSKANGASAAVGESPAREPTKKAERDFVRLPAVAAEAPTPGTSAVLGGKDGWLYLNSEFFAECNPTTPRADVVNGLRRLQSILAASGRKFVFTLAPDKSTAAPEHLPDSYGYSDCAPEAKQATYDGLTDAAIPGYLDARSLIDGRATKEKRDYYLRKDTHWNGLAEVAVARELARGIDPALVRGVRVNELIGEYTGDLTTLLGTPTSDQMIGASLERPGVTVQRDANAPIQGVDSARTTATSTGAPLVPGRTLLIGDSFAGGLVDKLAPFSAEQVWIHNGAVRQVPKTVADQIQASGTVVLVWNERYFSNPAYGVLWSPQFLDRLEQVLAAG